ncbi:MAG: Single-stranded DNA-binding protein [Candidatus Saccharicenans subterraneus]|uniref:Single-stranded DNA-binding protein n=1 Tax=Candidatus Saccharicenans subterraneus TaxID=2508984 RepID=A0A3E2BNK8_9BACT|nr:MAG: Single-stranded DNA-binding protein [Candidatus Saccharicenans subterraneum]
MRDRNSFNKVILVGNLVKKPEIRHIPSGRAVARFQVATNEQIYNRETRQATDRTEYHRIVAWGPLAEFCDRFLETGRQVMVEGRLRWRSWEDRDGNRRNSTEVEAVNIVLLGKRVPPQAEAQVEAGAVEDFPEISEPATEEFPEETPSTEGDDEIPF